MMESIDVKDFDLVKTLECGQFFRFERIDNSSSKAPTFIVLHRDKIFKLKQEGDKLYYAGTDEAFLRDFFRLDDDYKSIIKSISKDDFINKAIKENYGLRLIRQDPWECLISYICSANNNIPRIKKNLASISESFGEPIALEYKDKDSKGNKIEHKGYAFPMPGRLSNLEALKACRVGFRAGFIKQTNESIEEPELISLRRADYSVARERLMQLKGVGEKIADCVCLFALDKNDSFPVDVWIRRVMLERYMPDKDSTKPLKNSEIGDFARGYFGKNAGYANQFLFYYRREMK